MKTKNALLGLSLLLAMPLTAQEKNYVSEVWVADQGNGKYKNPILYADYSDPDACRVCRFYTPKTSLTGVSSALPFPTPSPLSKHRNVRSMATAYGRLPSAIITVNSTSSGATPTKARSW